MDNSLKNMFYRLINEYANLYAEVNRTQNYRHPFGSFIRNDIPNEIRRKGDIDQSKYIVKGSNGAGRWTTVPWIAIFDRRITESAQRGVYLVYLLNKDKKELYLTLNQGATDISQNGAVGNDGKLAFTGVTGSSNAKSLAKLRSNAVHIQGVVGSVPFATDELIKCGAPNYDAGAVCYKKYTLDNLPDEEILFEDLKEFVAIYSRYAEWYLNGTVFAESNNEWWPSKEEYDPQITKEKWLELLNAGAFNESVLAMLGQMQRRGGAATCAELAEETGKQASHYIMTAVHAAEKVQKLTGCPILENQEDSKYWPVLFVGKRESVTDRYIWKIRDELREALSVFDIDKHLPKKDGEKEMTTKEQVASIRKYIEAKGFNYDGSLIENFYLGLKSKPFVILAGTSGTGKTRLVRLFAEAIGCQDTYKLVSVRPDWSDSSDLFGHVDLNQKFVPGAIIDFVKQAELNPNKPYFLCLDEMNLARVEYYMSDILSAIETRRYESGMIITDPVVSSANYGNDPHAPGRYGKVILPGNLYIVGTVNMDETTFPFSKKVLDRANTIEFSYVDLLSMPSFSTATTDKITVTNEFLVSKYITLNDCDAVDKEYIAGVCTTLSRINGILEIANAHIGYRVRDEIVFYMLNNREADLLDDKVAFDNQIMQKILPRIQGSSESIKTMLGELLKICESEKYDASAKKINFMIKRYEEDGFTSYWL